jgi:hypothetical protein
MKNFMIATFLTLASVTSYASDGTAKVLKLQQDLSVTNIRINGQAAKSLFYSFQGTILDLGNGVDDLYSHNKIGENISCFRSKKVRSKLEKYSCDISLRDGKALPGAAG